MSTSPLTAFHAELQDLFYSITEPIPLDPDHRVISLSTFIRVIEQKMEEGYSHGLREHLGVPSTEHMN